MKIQKNSKSIKSIKVSFGIKLINRFLNLDNYDSLILKLNILEKI